MKKKFLMTVVLIYICIGLCGCNNQKKVDAHLEAGEYIEAYNDAETSEKKNMIVAENFLAFACYDLAVNVNSDLALNIGSFGQAEAKATDTYTPNDSVFSIDNFAKLAEYVSLMAGRDVLGEYYYAVLEVAVESSTKYCLFSVEVDNKTCNLIYVWDTLEQTVADDNIEALYKYIARQIEKNGTTIDKSAVERINQKYLTDSPESVKFEFDLSK